MNQEFQQIVSLGLYCRAKHQVQRVFGKHIASRGVFDWQITSEAALVAYFENDFRGMYDLADLVIEDGNVKNARYDSIHIHDFPTGMTEEKLHELYAEARVLHDRWCASTYRALSNNETTLIVLCGDVSSETISAVEAHIRRWNPAKRFRLLQEPLVGRGGEWKGDDDIWSQHLSPFNIQSSLQTRAVYQLYRLRKNLRYLLPASMRQNKITPSTPG